MSVSAWMSWEGGVDLVALTSASLAMPDVIVHVARMVHTPVGSAPSGMILIPGGPGGAPKVMGFVSTNPALAKYFGPKVFAGTPFEGAPALTATFDFTINAPSTASVKVVVAGVTIELTLSGLGAVQAANRPAGNMPFDDRSLEAVAGSVSLKVDGKVVNVIVPPASLGGGPAAVWSPAGIYSR